MSSDKETVRQIPLLEPSEAASPAVPPIPTVDNQETWKETTSIVNPHIPQSLPAAECPIVDTEGLKRIMSPKDCVSDLINLKKEFPVEIYENERYAPFSNWSASSLLPSGNRNFRLITI